MTESISNNIGELVSAIIDEPNSKIARKNLYQQIKNGRFFLAVHGIPLNLYNALDSNQVFVNQQLMNMPLQLAVADNGSKALLAYLDKETLDANAPNHWAIEVSGSDLLNLVILNHEFSATVLKGSMGWAGIAKEDARLLMKGYAV